MNIDTGFWPSDSDITVIRVKKKGLQLQRFLWEDEFRGYQTTTGTAGDGLSMTNLATLVPVRVTNTTGATELCGTTIKSKEIAQLIPWTSWDANSDSKCSVYSDNYHSILSNAENDRLLSSMSIPSSLSYGNIAKYNEEDVEMKADISNSILPTETFQVVDNEDIVCEESSTSDRSKGIQRSYLSYICCGSVFCPKKQSNNK